MFPGLQAASIIIMTSVLCTRCSRSLKAGEGRTMFLNVALLGLIITARSLFSNARMDFQSFFVLMTVPVQPS